MGKLAWFPPDQDWGPKGGPALAPTLHRTLCDTLESWGVPVVIAVDNSRTLEALFMTQPPSLRQNLVRWGAIGKPSYQVRVSIHGTERAVTRACGTHS